MRHPRWNHKTVQYTREGNNIRQCIRGNKKRHIRTTAIKTYRKWTTRKTIRKTLINPKQYSLSNLDTQMETHPIHPRRQQLWSKIRWKRKCTTPDFCPARRLHNHTGLGGKTLCWHHPILGPPKSPDAYIHARLHQSRFAILQPPHPKQTTGITIPIHSAQLRCQSTIYKRDWHHKKTQLQRKEINTTSQQNPSLPRMRSWHHSPYPDQWQHVTTIQNHGNNHEYNTPNYRLRCHTRIGSPHIFTKPKETIHTQQSWLLQKTRGTQPGRRTIFPFKQHNIPTKKWRNTHYCTNNQECHFISSQCWTRRPLCSLQRSSIHTHYSWIIRTQTI